MNSSQSEMGGFAGRRGWIIAVIAILLVPFVYAALILTAKWGPYDNLANLPVAVVNQDEGGMSGENQLMLEMT